MIFMAEQTSEIKSLHPGMFFKKEDIRRFRDNCKKDAIAAEILHRIRNDADKAMKSPLPQWSARWEFDTGSIGQLNLGAVATEAFRFVTATALLYLLEGNEQYARKAVDITLTYCSFDFWTSPRFFIDYRLPWRGTLETRIICQIAACCYDWLYDFMSFEERDRIRFCLAYKGVQPLIQDWADSYTRLPLISHNKPWGNWWSVSIGGAGIGALALLGEHPLAERWLKLCKEGIEWFFNFEGASVPKVDPELYQEPEGTYYPQNFDSQGGYYEGLNYLEGVLVNMFLFTEPYKNIMGEDLFSPDLMRKVCDFILYNSVKVNGSMRGINFDDCRAGFANSATVTSLLASKLRHEGMQWYFKSSRNNFNDKSLFGFMELPAFTLIWYDPDLEASDPQNPQPVKVYPSVGWASMRSGWGGGDVMLGLKCGATAGHAHPDAGSFVLYYKEKCLVMDAGCCGYEMPEQNQYYQNSIAHNVALVYGKGQTKRLPGEIKSHAGVGECAMVCANAAAPYEGMLDRFNRRVLFLDRKYYVILDELESKEASAFEWLLHFDGKLENTDKGFLVTQDDARLLAKFIEPEQFLYHLEKGYRPMHEDLSALQTAEEKHACLEEIDYLRLKPAVPANRQAFVTVLYPHSSGDTLPVIRSIRNGECHGVEIDRGSAVEIAVFNTGESSLSIASSAGVIETDAKAAGIVFRKASGPACGTGGCSCEVASFVMESGSYLKFNGKELYRIPVKETVAYSFHKA
ncbi:MAG: hypothetical protein FIA99_08740 [Ruminiclostridium sp.]|nr:hypothetical protein [Ruminiclostridium sp.]